jgi:DNA polymerase III subunit delta
MPIYFFWGDDDFAIALAVQHLQKTVLDPNWSQFNYDKIPANETDATSLALIQAMTPVFGMGERLVWLVDTTIAQSCSEDLLLRLQQTLPAIPSTSHLLLTSTKKLDSRLKSTKILQKYADIREFSLIPPWKTAELVKQVRQVAREVGVTLTPDASELLAELVGNNTRQLWSELEKLRLYNASKTTAIDAEVVGKLVNGSSQSTLQLGETICSGNVDRALGTIADLVNRNEPPLKIVAALVGQFRTLAIVKLKIEAGERDEKAIATAAEIANPKRIFILRKQIQGLSSRQLLASLPILLELELALKRGADPISTLQTQAVKLCQIFGHSHSYKS